MGKVHYIDEKNTPLEASDIHSSSKILVIEDDENILNLLRAYLESAGYQVKTAAKGDEGLMCALTHAYDLCVVDIMLPNKNGIEVVTRMRKAGCETPILFLTARGSETDILDGFGVGADDYVVKPFSPRVLLVRIEAILRRRHATPYQAGRKITFGPFQLDEDQRNCFINGEQVELTPHEYRILQQFLRRPGRVYERTALIACIYGSEDAVSLKSIDVHIHNLRCKLNDEDGNLIQTVRGFGYKLASESEYGRTIDGLNSVPG